MAHAKHTRAEMLNSNSLLRSLRDFPNAGSIRPNSMLGHIFWLMQTYHPSTSSEPLTQNLITQATQADCFPCDSILSDRHVRLSRELHLLRVDEVHRVSARGSVGANPTDTVSNPSP